MHGHDYEAIGAGQEVEFGTMMENRVHFKAPNHSNSSSTILLLSLRETSIHYPTEKSNRTAHPTRIPCICFDANHHASNITFNHLDIPLTQQSQIDENSHIYSRPFPEPGSPIPLPLAFSSPQYIFPYPFIRCFGLFGQIVVVFQLPPCRFCVANMTRHQR